MEDQDVLSKLRASTRPIHAKLDQGGIGQQMKNNEFGAVDYQNWLKKTIQINSFLFREKENFKTSSFYKYVNGDLGLSHLFEDLGTDEIDPVLFTEDKMNLVHDDFIIAIVYTYLGSTLGSKFIHKYVKENIAEASTEYLTHMGEQSAQWKTFLQELSAYKVSVDPDSIANYAKEIFLTIHEIQH